MRLTINLRWSFGWAATGINGRTSGSFIITDNYTFSFDQSSHLIRVVNFVQRDPIYRDFFTKLRRWASR